MKNFLSILLSLLFISCGTQTSVKSFRRYLREVDSTHRGLAVFNEDNKIEGITPFYTYLSRSTENKFYYKENGKRIKIHFSCELVDDRSKQSLENCDTPLVINNKGPLGKYAPRKRLVILPPPTEDLKLARSIMYLFEENSQTREYQIIPYKKYRYKLQLHLLSAEKIKPYAENSPKILNSFLEEIKADYFLMFERVKDSKEVTPVVYDSYSKKIAKKMKPIKVQEESFEGNSFGAFLIKNIHLLPNSFALNYFFQGRVEGTKTIGVNEEPFESAKDEIGDHPNAIPKYFPLFSIEDVPHPFHFRRYDMQLRGAPSLNAFSFSYSNEITPGRQFSMQAQGYGVFYNGALDFIHPLGTTSFGAGIGYGYLKGTDNFGSNVSGGTFFTRLSYSHIVFFNKRLYSQLGVNQYSLPEDIFGNDEIRVDNYKEFYFSLGYYLPELKEIFSLGSL